MSPHPGSALTAITLFLLLSLGGCGDEPEAASVKAEQTIPVRIARAQPALQADAVSAYGTVRPQSEAKLSFKIGGLIKEIHVDQGDRVTQGQILAELDTREIDSHVSRAMLAVEKAKRDVDRMAPLAAKGFASTQRMEDARTALDAARAELRAVEFDRSLSHITASAEGVVLMRHADPHEMIGVGTPVLTVSNGNDAYVVKAGLSDRDVARVRLGDTASIHLDAFEGMAMQGRVVRLAAASDPRSGTFETEISIIDPGRPLTSGFMGEVRIQASIAGSNANSVSIPASAIVESHGAQASVFTVDHQTSKAQRRRITVGALDGEMITVTNGLAPKEAVVTAGAAYLRDGVLVRIAEDMAITP